MIGKRRIIFGVQGVCPHCGSAFSYAHMLVFDAGKRDYDGAWIFIPASPLFCETCFLTINVIYIADHDILRAFNFHLN